MTVTQRRAFLTEVKTHRQDPLTLDQIEDFIQEARKAGFAGDAVPQGHGNFGEYVLHGLFIRREEDQV